MTIARIILTTIALVFVATSCQVDVPPKCQLICQHLEDCGMLRSSSIGDTLTGCLTKCAVSSATSQDQLRECLPDEDFGDPPSIPGGVTLDYWCEDRNCAVSSRCLSSIYEMEVLGASSVGYTPCIPAEGEVDANAAISVTEDEHVPSSCVAETEQATCGGGMPGQTQAAIELLCQSFSLAEVRLESNELIEVLASGACSDVLRDSPDVRDDISPGLYNVTLTLRAGPLADDACRKVYSKRSVLVASASTHVSVFLPTLDGPGHVHGCEDSQLTCFDALGLDEDADGASNCDDPDCQPACIETGPLCSDGLDNDGDELIDCEDPNCIDELVCVSPEGGSETG